MYQTHNKKVKKDIKKETIFMYIPPSKQQGIKPTNTDMDDTFNAGNIIPLIYIIISSSHCVCA